MITVTAFRWVPDFARGQVRDLRVRWALEEAGIPYQSRPLTFDEKETPEYRRLQPFGQVPAMQDGELELFESGAIVLNIAERSERLMPADERGRDRARAWLIAALNSIEPPLGAMVGTRLFHGDEPWAEGAEKSFGELASMRLTSLSRWLGEKDWLEDSFTCGDLMMATVLRIPEAEMLQRWPNLAAYLARCEARPAFQRALAAQLADFDAEPPVAA